MNLTDSKYCSLKNIWKYIEIVIFIGTQIKEKMDNLPQGHPGSTTHRIWNAFSRAVLHALIILFVIWVWILDPLRRLQHVHPLLLTLAMRRHWHRQARVVALEAVAVDGGALELVGQGRQGVRVQRDARASLGVESHFSLNSKWCQRSLIVYWV